MTRRVLVGFGLAVSLGVASGAAAGTTPRATAAKQGVRVVVECDRPASSDASARWAHQPDQVDLRCRNGGSISDIDWNTYRQRQATGEGDFGLLIEGYKRAYPVSFELDRTRRCKAARARIFTRITFVFTGKRPRGFPVRGREKLPCGRGDLRVV